MSTGGILPDFGYSRYIYSKGGGIWKFYEDGKKGRGNPYFAGNAAQRCPVVDESGWAGAVHSLSIVDLVTGDCAISEEPCGDVDVLIGEDRGDYKKRGKLRF